MASIAPRKANSHCRGPPARRQGSTQGMSYWRRLTGKFTRDFSASAAQCNLSGAYAIVPKPDDADAIRWRWKKMAEKQVFVGVLPQVMVIEPDDQVCWLSDAGSLRIEFDP